MVPQKPINIAENSDGEPTMVYRSAPDHDSVCRHDNIVLIKRWFKEVWNERRIDKIDELMSPDFIAHYEHEEIIGSNNWKNRFYDTLLQAVPDFHIEVKDIVADRNMVVIRLVASGVLTGELFGVAPTHEKFDYSGMSWTRIDNGRLAENWNNWNMTYFFRRLHSEIKILRGILPLCSFCKKIRDDKGYWEQVDIYLRKYSEANISHGLCPECSKKHYPELYDSSFPDNNKE